MSAVATIIEYVLPPNMPVTWSSRGEWMDLIDVNSEPKKMGDTRKWPRITAAVWLLECPPETEQKTGIARILRVNRRIEFENEPAGVRIAYRKVVEGIEEIVGDRALWDAIMELTEGTL
jgi:hypothetical protein